MRRVNNEIMPQVLLNIDLHKYSNILHSSNKPTNKKFSLFTITCLVDFEYDLDNVPCLLRRWFHAYFPQVIRQAWIDGMKLSLSVSIFTCESAAVDG